MNTEKDAKNAILELERQITPKLASDLKDKTVYNNVYNPTEGFLKDIGEATGQKISSDRKQFSKWLDDSALAPTWLRNYVKYLIEKHNKDRILESDVTQSLVRINNSLLAKGRQLTPVTHSQGNLFVNETYFGIQEPLRQGMGIVSVANPDDVVADRDQQHPVQMGRVVEPDDALLLSYELPWDIFYHYYSKGNLDALTGASLSHTTVLPFGLN